MFSENTQKQIQLISGIVVALGGLVGVVTELFGKTIKAFGQFPPWAAWIGYAAAADTIKPPGDFWAVVEWLNAQPGIDLTRPPERMKPGGSRG
jgi:hypothetical protein